MKVNRLRLSVAVLFFVAAALGVEGTAYAQGTPQYKVGDRVAADFGVGYLDSVIIRVDPKSPFPYRVHPLGYLSTMDSSFMGKMLKTPGSVPTKPQGGIADDPYLFAIQGKKAFHPVEIYRAAYECWTLSGGGSASLQAAGILNFTILDQHRYRDIKGNTSTYKFNAANGTLVFEGGTLGGQRATYKQASNPPTASQPPSVTFVTSGDSCDARLH